MRGARNGALIAGGFWAFLYLAHWEERKTDEVGEEILMLAILTGLGAVCGFAGALTKGAT